MHVLKIFLLISTFAAVISNQGSQAILTEIIDFVARLAFQSVISHFTDDVIQSTTINNLQKEYDFIIVGSGPAGSVIASRLSENKTWKVLLLEAGFSETRTMWVPFFAGLLQWTGYNWGYTAEPQERACKAMAHERCALPRGRGLGGTTLINYMVYSRGNRGDYDRLAAAGFKGWDYDSVLPYYKKLEQVHLETPSVAGTRGTNGRLSIETSYHSALTRSFVDAGVEMGYQEYDYNGGQGLGFSYAQATIKTGRRFTIARAYLEDAQTRSNLHILTGATASKIIIDSGTKTATGVEFIYRRQSFKVKATKEVIVSAGAYGSPKLLILSGIGPQAHLKSLGIQSIVDLPVGRNLQDHITYTGLDILINQTIEHPLDAFNPINILKWVTTGKGPLSSLGGCSGLSFVKTNASTEVGNYPDVELLMMSLGSLHTDYGLFNRRFIRIRDEYYNEAFRPMEGYRAFSIFPSLLHPKSKGYLELRSTNPMDDPIIRHNYLSSPEDKRTLIAGIRSAIRVLTSNAFKKYGARLSTVPVPDCEKLLKDSDDYWSCSIERFATSLYNEVGTCSMGNKTNGVVDNNLNVHGIKRLRVADTSIIPFALSGHTTAISAMVGEKVSDIIKTTY